MCLNFWRPRQIEGWPEVWMFVCARAGGRGNLDVFLEFSLLHLIGLNFVAEIVCKYRTGRVDRLRNSAKTRQLRAKFEPVYWCLYSYLSNKIILYTPTNRTHCRSVPNMRRSLSWCQLVLCLHRNQMQHKNMFQEIHVYGKYVLFCFKSKKYNKKSWVYFNVKQKL
jgi:hypothetical protein